MVVDNVGGAGDLSHDNVANACSASDDRDVVKCFKQIALTFPLITLGLAGCGGGFPSPKPPSYNISVGPSLVTVAAGSTTTFTALFTPSRPAAGSLTWSVSPAQGGTITSAGVYTASGTAGNYTVVATWTPSNLAAGTTISGSAAVDVLPPVQLGAELNTELIEASGAIQVSGTIQNAAIVGQLVPSAISTGANGNVQIRNGFTIPVVCTGPNNSCP